MVALRTVLEGIFAAYSVPTRHRAAYHIADRDCRREPGAAAPTFETAEAITSPLMAIAKQNSDVCGASNALNVLTPRYRRRRSRRGRA
jgi:hypothetical protein